MFLVCSGCCGDTQHYDWFPFFKRCPQHLIGQGNSRCVDVFLRRHQCLPTLEGTKYFELTLCVLHSIQLHENPLTHFREQNPKTLKIIRHNDVPAISTDIMMSRQAYWISWQTSELLWAGVCICPLHRWAGAASFTSWNLGRSWFTTLIGKFQMLNFIVFLAR